MPGHRFKRFPLLMMGALLVGGCELLGPPKPESFPTVIRVESDPGVAVPGAEVTADAKLLGATGADGQVALSLKGREGDVFALSVRCPEQFRSPEKPLTLSLRRLVGAQAAEFAVTCPPKTRKAVVVVRAQNGPNLPVTHLGKQVAITDASGTAHLIFQLEAGSALELRIAAEGAPKTLRPAEAVASFTVRDRDDIYVFDQKFEEVRVKPKPRPRARVDDGPRPL